MIALLIAVFICGIAVGAFGAFALFCTGRVA